MSEAEMYKARAEACRIKAKKVLDNAKICFDAEDLNQFDFLIKEVQLLLDESAENWKRANIALDEELAKLPSVRDILSNK